MLSLVLSRGQLGQAIHCWGTQLDAARHVKQSTITALSMITTESADAWISVFLPSERQSSTPPLALLASPISLRPKLVFKGNHNAHI